MSEEDLAAAKTVIAECFFGPHVWHNSSIKWWEDGNAWLVRFDGHMREFDLKSDAFKWLSALHLLAANQDHEEVVT